VQKRFKDGGGKISVLAMLAVLKITLRKKEVKIAIQETTMLKKQY
jgi:hypothetical protein